MEVKNDHLEELYSALERNIKKAEYKKIVKKSDEILKGFPEENDAFRCKVTALIQLGLVQDVLLALNENKSFAEDFKLEKAYCLYKSGKHQEAIGILESFPNSVQKLEIEAQILYRLGRHSDCIERYSALSVEGNMTNEMKSNLVAAYVGAGRSKEIPALLSDLKMSPKDSFDLAYNVACSLIEQMLWREAEDMLLLARRLGQESLIEDELSEEEVYNELCPITVQLAFVQHMNGKSNEAVEAYVEVLRRRPSDAPSLAVACCNLVALRASLPASSKDLLDSVKQMEKVVDTADRKTGPAATTPTGLLLPTELDQRLSTTQRTAILSNYFLLLLQSNKVDQAAKLLPALSRQLSGDWVSLLRASLLVRSKKPQEALEALVDYSHTAHRTNLSADFLLSLAQIALLSGNSQEASQALLSLDTSLKGKPAVVATVVDLLERESNVAGAEAALDAALEGSLEAGSGRGVLLASAGFKLRHGKAEQAVSLFRKLLGGSAVSSADRIHAEALVGVVEGLAAAMDLPEEAEVLEEAMAAVPGLPALDAAKLVQGFGSNTGSSGRGKRAGLEEEPGRDKDRSKSKAKKKRKVIWPKGFDPANPGPAPDPERWLPKRERSSFKPRRKDKRAAMQLRGAQGTVQVEDSSSAAAPKTGKAAKGASPAEKKSDSPAFGSVPLAGKKKGKKGRK